MPGTNQDLITGLVKVFIFVNEGDVEWESLWAESIGGDLYRLKNSPFYAHGFSFDDIVSALSRDGRLIVSEVVKRGGHSTYRVFLHGIANESGLSDQCAPLERLGCTFERATQRCFAIDVPSQTDIYAVFDLLNRGETSHIWTFEEAHCGHPLDQP